MPTHRRDAIKQLITGAAISAAEALFPGITFGAVTKLEATLPGVAWKKTPCRFCGTGCGLLVGIKDNRAVAVKGDPASPVNQGLACVKGYHSIMALYGSDRLKTALVRKKREEDQGNDEVDSAGLGRSNFELRVYFHFHASRV